MGGCTFTFMFIYIFQERQGVRGGAASHSRDSDTSIHIGSVQIEIVQGDLTKQRIGAIVNSTDETFTLRGIAWNVVRECLYKAYKLSPCLQGFQKRLNRL